MPLTLKFSFQTELANFGNNCLELYIQLPGALFMQAQIGKKIHSEKISCIFPNKVFLIFPEMKFYSTELKILHILQ